MKKLAIGAAVTASLALSATAMADIDEKEFLVVGTWGNLFNWKEHESRMWNDVLPAASGGKITANAKFRQPLVPKNLTTDSVCVRLWAY